jgi:hypothetical protein
MLAIPKSEIENETNPWVFSSVTFFILE